MLNFCKYVDYDSFMNEKPIVETGGKLGGGNALSPLVEGKSL
jgi:hypothetical protein